MDSARKEIEKAGRREQCGSRVFTLKPWIEIFCPRGKARRVLSTWHQGRQAVPIEIYRVAFSERIVLLC